MRQVVNYFKGYIRKMGGEQEAMLQPHETYVCANVMLALNSAGAFKILNQNIVVHDSAIVKSMQLKTHERGQDL